MSLAKYIDHTALKPDTTMEQIDALLEEAKEHGFKSVCVNPTHVAHAKEVLEGSDVLVCTVIGFPLGATTSEVKAFETEDAIKKGANEVDMVINIGALKDGRDEDVKKDIESVVSAANGVTTKVIIEASLLTDAEKVRACELAVAAGADFVKTSTGFSTGGATAEDIKLMRETVGPDLGVKASGGIRSYEDVKTMIDNGATRIGASAGVKILKGETSDSDY
ncbi:MULTISPECIES: deoxyribose-phosphate aldolase [Mammaliicoccus]|uniref:Deoxyribose-phosphate aldolase n=1 Tax=Mammaliicoccus fleurettii TaxID=150056 RepID=A0ABS5MNH6_9STAP|nr:MULTISPECIES: deoxyribose-phosphate aldolase [Mammaliicoccus]HCN59901.1 deoxyribose-phosphate aldolase [Staphylococcus sp.]MBL0846734.1 deoxyribose-phosphate aldolase [Mammaliicoccus fleurettii]MBS3672290.1 deoxyribose-phosphate aldolase [Mammaliicoccus fleurettii]MBS3697196.1 deoxyribose-phosphate aldolase [Mammaliicoccus fleurettii]MBW0765256.1 deoxyribose-phosphate aldolase [Mammaliicoccus fleurettii]